MTFDQSPKIVISYRRTDSAMAGRIFDRLAQRFDRSNLFIDIDNIPYGVDFRRHIEDELAASDLLIAVVGKKWLGTRSQPRIAAEGDPVRIEIETALRQEIDILPVLLDGTKMPKASQLPPSLTDFTYLNAVDLESGRDFNVHMERLIGAIDTILDRKFPDIAARGPTPFTQKKKPSARLSLLILSGLALAAGAAFAGWLWITRDRPQMAAVNRSAVPQNFCNDLKQAMSEAPSNFDSILGPKSLSWSWSARLQLDGWNDCEVREIAGPNDRYFTCSLAPLKTMDGVNDQLSQAEVLVKNSLGPGWRTRTGQYAGNARKVSLEAEQTDPIVTLQTNYFEKGDSWSLLLDVRAAH